MLILLSLLFAHESGKESIIGVEKGEVYDLACTIGDEIVVTDKALNGKVVIKITSPDNIAALANGRVVIIK